MCGVVMRSGFPAMCALLLVLGCQRAPVRDAGTVRPSALRYRAVHRGDHRPWTYVAHVQLERITYGGQPAWRQTYRIEDTSPSGEEPARWESTSIVHRDTLALLASQDVSGGSFGASRTRLVARGDRLVGHSESAGKRTELDIALRGLAVKDFDLLVLTVPLRSGGRKAFALIDEANERLRPFSLSVERRELVRVPAGEFDAWRVVIAPLDGDRRLAATYHVSGGSPRVVLRREYVVNPETRGTIRRSVGVEELEASGGGR